MPCAVLDLQQCRVLQSSFTGGVGSSALLTAANSSRQSATHMSLPFTFVQATTARKNSASCCCVQISRRSGYHRAHEQHMRGAGGRGPACNASVVQWEEGTRDGTAVQQRQQYTAVVGGSLARRNA